MWLHFIQIIYLLHTIGALNGLDTLEYIKNPVCDQVEKTANKN